MSRPIVMPGASVLPMAMSVSMSHVDERRVTMDEPPTGLIARQQADSILARQSAYSISHVDERRVTICRMPAASTASTAFSAVSAASKPTFIDVPHALIDCLANDMPRLLQLFRHWDRNNSGEVSLHDFERALYALGVRYSPTQVRNLFRLLDADSNQRVSLEELLMLKFAIDNHITDLPARPGMMTTSQKDGYDDDDDDDAGIGQDADLTGVITLRIEDVDKLPTRRNFGLRFCSAVAMPMLGAVWKSQYRPHHALALDTHLEHTRGPPAVHAAMRVCRQPEHGPGFHVRLNLVPLRGEKLQGERVRYVYRAGGEPSAERFVEDSIADIERAAERAVVELQGLLCEVRQIDLKLEEVRLMQRGESRERAMQKLVTLKRMLIALASDNEEAIISHTRYTRKEFYPKHVVRGGQVLRLNEVLNPKPRHRRRVKAVAKASLIVLAIAALAQFIVLGVVWDDRHSVNHYACEFQHYACRVRPWQYECAPNGTIRLLESNRSATSCADVIPPFVWGMAYLDVACDRELQARSWWFFVPLPLLLLAAVVLPIGTFYKNATRTTFKKVLIWTPVVPLILIQCVFRVAILFSVVPHASDTL